MDYLGSISPFVGILARYREHASCQERPIIGNRQDFIEDEAIEAMQLLPIFASPCRSFNFSVNDRLASHLPHLPLPGDTLPSKPRFHRKRRQTPEYTVTAAPWKDRLNREIHGDMISLYSTFFVCTLTLMKTSPPSITPPSGGIHENMTTQRAGIFPLSTLGGELSGRALAKR